MPKLHLQDVHPAMKNIDAATNHRNDGLRIWQEDVQSTWIKKGRSGLRLASYENYLGFEAVSSPGFHFTFVPSAFATLEHGTQSLAAAAVLTSNPS